MAKTLTRLELHTKFILKFLKESQQECKVQLLTSFQKANFDKHLSVALQLAGWRVRLSLLLHFILWCDLSDQYDEFYQEGFSALACKLRLGPYNCTRWFLKWQYFSHPCSSVSLPLYHENICSNWSIFKFNFKLLHDCCYKCRYPWDTRNYDQMAKVYLSLDAVVTLEKNFKKFWLVS